MGILTGIERGLKSFVLELQEIFYFSLRLTYRVFSRPIYVYETFEQMHFIGVGSLYLVILTGLFAGQGMAIQFAAELATMGSKDYLGRILAIAVVRELGPVLTGLMIAARVSAGITAEIGAMVSSQQVDAMRAFGIDPLRKLAAPRLISLVVMVPVLTRMDDRGADRECLLDSLLGKRARQAPIRKSVRGDFEACSLLPRHSIHLDLQGLYNHRRHKRGRGIHDQQRRDILDHATDSELPHNKAGYIAS